MDASWGVEFSRSFIDPLEASALVSVDAAVPPKFPKKVLASKLEWLFCPILATHISSLGELDFCFNIC